MSDRVLVDTNVLVYEGFNAGQMTEGVRFVNPFAEDFHLEDWVG